jgi:nitrogen regulatory protein P-II 1
MREVKAFVRPQRLDHVLAALREIAGLPGVTVSRVHGYSGFHQPGDPRPPVENVQADFTKLETIVPDALVERVVAAIGQAGHTGRGGDGVVFVVPVEQFVRIRDVEPDDRGAA